MTDNLQGIGMTSQRTRERMVQRLVAQGLRNQKILDVMRNTPRHLFMDDALASRAYEDTALPISYGQTISQPYIVARMTELLLEKGPRQRVLEVGTGSGYQTAILSPLVDYIYTVERIAPLQKKAKDILWGLKLRNISYHYGDGSWGWPEQAPFDGILVTAAPMEIPDPLLQQLTVGGVMVIPAGREGQQYLYRVVRGEGGCEVEAFDAVSFVPLLSGRV